MTTASAATPAPAPTAAPDSATVDDRPVALRTSGLTRRFGSQLAVDDVDLEVPQGAVFGFLGPNGSGKTTTIRMLLGLLSADAGEIELLGHPMPRDVAQVLPRVGALIEGPAFHPYLTGRRNLRRLDVSDATANPRTSTQRIDAALARVGLSAAADKKYRQYSLGMKQRLGLAAALLQPRDLLILDEPTNGLDPQGTREVRKLVRELASDGTTVVVSSHLLSEIQQVATHVAMMVGGRLVRQGELDDVLADGAPTLRITTPDLERAATVLRELGLTPVPGADAGVLTTRLGAHGVDEIAAALVHADVRLLGLVDDRPGLEDLFVSITGEGFDVLR